MTGRDEFSELISAFLDGEVTPEEQAQVEERLVDNAEDRRLFEEMRAMRNGLQSLPRRELEKDLSEIILRRAERAMLASEPPPTGDESAAAEPEEAERKPSAAAIVASRPMPPEPASWRPLIWVGATVAAAVLLMTMAGPWFRGDREVVRHTMGESDGSSPAAPDASRGYSSFDAEAEPADGRKSFTPAKKMANAGSFDADELDKNRVRYHRETLPRIEDVAGGRGLKEIGDRPGAVT